MLLLYAGYATLVYGVDHVSGNCTPFKSVIWMGTTQSTSCGASSTPTPATSTNTGAGQTGTSGTVSGASNNPANPSGDAYTIPPAVTNNPGGYTIVGQGSYTNKNPFHLPFTNLNSASS
jgi:hypothetical protein